MIRQEIDNLKIGDYILWISYNRLDCYLAEIVDISIEDRTWFAIKWHYSSYDITNPDDNMIDDIYLLDTEFSIPDEQTMNYYHKLMIFK